MRYLHYLRRVASAGLLLAVAYGSAPALARPAPAEIVIEAGSGRVLHARDADRSRQPASIAKVMTLFLVFDALDAGRLREDKRLVVSRFAASREPSRLGLRAGEKMTVRNAMRAVAVQSANDAAVVLAEAVAGDERRFAALMTAKARALGMADTVFGNATGLPDARTRTTARDIAVLARGILRAHPDRYALFGRREIKWNDRSMTNHNHLLGRVTGVDGIKTGYTARAGFTLAASAKRDGRRLIAVVLGATSRQARDDRVGELLERGFLGRLERSAGAGAGRNVRGAVAGRKPKAVGTLASL
ncbi:D-alanyl-D-alanine carboxypeptidase family protein [uncultured Sphingomonas sp.]|uniref:D-alanyl-D-alanine carboxypeptidase family protein n=1 Tax=uncultured Sphingomonas sp. TaxID=158754 RepID=UPI0035C97F74